MPIILNKKIKKKNGFNLVELMVSVGISCFLFLLSAPAYVAWMANLRVKNISESVQLGLQQSKSEAIRRNQPVSFTLNNDTSWSVNLVSDDTLLNQKVSSESSSTTQIEALPANSSIVTFNGFGTIVTNQDGSPTITTVNVVSNSGFDGVQSLRVSIGAGGTVFICNPQVTNNTDNRFCRSV